MFNKILIAVDLNETCSQVVEEAIALAKSHHATLKFVHVISTEAELYMPYSLYPVMDGYTEFSETALGQYEKRVKAHKERCRETLMTYQNQALDDNVNAEIEILTGEPGHAICDAMKSWQGDLILIGNRGLRGLKEIVLGSVSNFVMHHAPCSVLVLRPSLYSQDMISQDDSHQEPKVARHIP